ncbi:hypothetical protein A3D77_02105 [Candidatus Gottesmanbacteria bacterium RIFCSPHIGHO2_02_FULL_39_11]|uniref:Polymerase nucleotidyl transferase domain-containing protein n=1 Tax=Candidatus Gottesmanbacteria bacterium RIFCSPHIGHO2_02_FULL_39_11 TaxID=1798382 RepID=A0A1F5ZUR3_9BACT|nr:MAG: hypothetical protein A3D77_02105 [Candidatus Gottesmanbacteria bacterium RIFCSPHIGHO2_02_FULL_39_11]
MVKKTINKKVLNQILHFSNLLKEEGISYDKLILFGSFAKGTNHKYSDIDLCVVSKIFDKDYQGWFDRLWRIKSKEDIDINPMPFTPDDLTNKYYTLASEIRKTGIVIQ